MSARLEGRGLGFTYRGGPTAVEGVDASVEAGAVTAFVGPNGSGKSTLLRLLCGLLRPQSGQVLLDGQRLSRFGGRARARAIAFLPQAVDPTFSFTAFEAVCLGRYPHTGAVAGLGAHDFNVARRCMRMTGTQELAGRQLLTLSGGERQRVLLASILAQEPRLLLLDEPTSALDIHHEVEVFELLRRLAADGYGIGLVTHDLNLAGAYSDVLVLLSQDHRVQAAGAPADVLTAARLSAAYEAPIEVGTHPLTGGPLVTAKGSG